ncbi:unnamed protein product, partial [marine sediment metagenome]
GEKPSQEKISEYYEHKRQFNFENPIPVKPLMHCSYDYPMFIIAVKETDTTSSRGCPAKIDPESMVVTEDQKKKVVDFCTKYCQPQDEYSKLPELEPHWYLTSLWG